MNINTIYLDNEDVIKKSMNPAMKYTNSDQPNQGEYSIKDGVITICSGYSVNALLDYIINVTPDDKITVSAWMYNNGISEQPKISIHLSSGETISDTPYEYVSCIKIGMWDKVSVSCIIPGNCGNISRISIGLGKGMGSCKIRDIQVDVHSSVKLRHDAYDSNERYCVIQNTSNGWIFDTKYSEDGGTISTIDANTLRIFWKRAMKHSKFPIGICNVNATGVSTCDVMTDLVTGDYIDLKFRNKDYSLMPISNVPTNVYCTVLSLCKIK